MWYIVQKNPQEKQGRKNYKKTGGRGLKYFQLILIWF